MSVSGIEAPTGLGFSAGLPGISAGSIGGGSAVTAPDAPTGPAGTHGVDFKAALTNSIDGLEAMHDTTDRLAVQAATGDLGAIHQYTLAATEMSVATQLTVAVRNKAVEAFNEIMRMQV